MKKITKNINDTNALDFYDTLTDKQRAKFDNEKDSFTIDFVEVSNIYTNLNAEQTGILFLAISMYAATGKKSGIDQEVLEALNADPKVLIQFNNIRNGLGFIFLPFLSVCPLVSGSYITKVSVLVSL